MCWISTKCIKHVATEDIPIFKYVYLVKVQHCFSFIRFFKYKYEQLYTLDSEIVVEQNSAFYFINEGFHSYDMSKIKEYKNESCLIKGIIPKGAIYYYDSTRKAYVSNQIILHKPSICA